MVETFQEKQQFNTGKVQEETGGGQGPCQGWCTSLSYSHHANSMSVFWEIFKCTRECVVLVYMLRCSFWMSMQQIEQANI